MRAPWARRALLEVSRWAALAMSAPARRAFERALEDPARAQDAVLRRAVASLSATRYGKSFGVAAGDGYAEFSAKVPIVDYEALRPWLDEQVAHENRALIPGPTRFYERTSGSSGGVKDVPYGDSLWRTFQRCFVLWLGDLLRRGPRLETGRCWISVSPWAAPGRTTARGVRVGLDDDGEYARGPLGGLLRFFWAVPPGVRAVSNPEDYKRVVAAHLLADEDLEVVSIWNPTLFRILLETMLARRDELLAELDHGETRAGTLSFPLARYGVRRRELLRAVLSASRVEDADWLAVWPRLKLISCWDMGEARVPARELAARFPGVFLQGKGHLATEAAVTIPWIEAGACLPLVDSVFLEFEERGGRVRRLHELVEGEEYALILTAEGGFARYRLGDRVRAGARFRGTPALELAGRCDAVSDLVGEKLEAGFVTAALDGLGTGASFRVLVPVHESGERGRYSLILDRSPDSPEDAAAALDAALRRSPLYDHARLLGQLAPPSVRVVPDAAERFLRFHAARGARWGGVKPAALVLHAEQGRELLRSMGL
jgi:hypothetical protein